jgi:hypothetical protein
MHLRTIMLRQIPATILAGLVYLAAWLVRGTLRIDPRKSP